MSKITNDGLTLSGTGCFVAVRPKCCTSNLTENRACHFVSPHDVSTCVYSFAPWVRDHTLRSAPLRSPMRAQFHSM